MKRTALFAISGLLGATSAKAHEGHNIITAFLDPFEGWDHAAAAAIVTVAIFVIARKLVQARQQRKALK